MQQSFGGAGGGGEGGEGGAGGGGGRGCGGSGDHGGYGTPPFLTYCRPPKPEQSGSSASQSASLRLARAGMPITDLVRLHPFLQADGSAELMFFMGAR